MERPDWAPEDIDIEKPNAARMYDYALGGSHNFAADRALVDQVEAQMPGASRIAHANRAYLRRVVRWLVGAGVRQFLDIGSGIPTLGNVHEVAQGAAPGARVLYVDIDPVAVAHGTGLLAGNPDATVIEGDLRHPDRIVQHPEAQATLDFSKPIAILLIAVLHFIADGDNPAALVGRLHDAVPPGSFLAISHGTPPPDRTDDAEMVRTVYQRTTTPLHLRTPDQILDLLPGWDLVEPGLVPVSDWHPDPGATPTAPQEELLGAVGRKAPTAIRMAA